MIEVKNISKNFNGQVVLKDISFEVNEGETLVLLGTSGSGKTTILRLMNRLLDLDGGGIFINGTDISKSAPEQLRRNIGYVLQAYGLFPHYTVAENIGIVPTLLKWPKEKIRERIKELMQKLQLPEDRYANAYPASLSGGQKQRVGLARALAADPPLLLMDEPFGALDPVTRADIVKEFKQLDELKKKTIILVTHDVEEAMELGDQIILLDKGTIVQTGAPADFLLKPASEFVQQFFSGQGFQSILKSVTLQQHWHELKDVDSKASADLSTDQSLWDALEILMQKNESAIIFDKKTQTKKIITLDQLQSYYHTNH